MADKYEGTNKAVVSKAEYNVQYVDCSPDCEEAILGLITTESGEAKSYIARVKVGDAPLFIASTQDSAEVFYTGLMSFEVLTISPECLVLRREPNTAEIKFSLREVKEFLEEVESTLYYSGS